MLLRTAGLWGFLTGLASVAQAQQTVDYHRIGLLPSAGSRTALYVGASQRSVVQLLGAPTKTSRFFFEIENAWARVLHYGPNQLFFLKDELVIAELHDGRWTVGEPGEFRFRVGSALTRKPAAPPAFGGFQVENKPGTARNLPYGAISYGAFGDAHHVADDDGYEILFDGQGRVTHIFFGSH